MRNVRIPRTINAAVDRLMALDRLLTATGWELAAIIATFVEPATKGGDRRSVDFNSRSGIETADAFAKRGIRGLSSPSTVLRYVDLWMDNVGERPTPGESITLPDLPFPPQERNKGSRTTTSNIGSTIRESPEMAAAAADAIAGLLEELPAENRSRLIGAVDRYRADHHPIELRPTSINTLDERWTDWLNDANTLFVTGARLADKSDQPGVVLGVHAEAAYQLYLRLTERSIDAEFRDLFTEGADR